MPSEGFRGTHFAIGGLRSTSRFAIGLAVHGSRSVPGDGSRPIARTMEHWSSTVPRVQVAGFATSPDHARLAYAVDTVGGEKFTLHVLDLATRRELLTRPIQVRCTRASAQPPMRAGGEGWQPAVSSMCARKGLLRLMISPRTLERGAARPLRIKVA